jgi:sugar/nucleoside kinase (ribokinase family)
MTLVGVGHALADAYAFVGEDVPKILGLHPGSFNQVPDYRMRAILLTLSQKTLMAGGSAANAVKLAARLGMDSHFVGQCGHDEAGQIFEAELLAAGVKVNLTRSDAPTGLCVTFLAPTSDRTVATFRSASGNLPKGLVGGTLIGVADTVVVEGYLLDEPEFLADLLDRCAQAGKAVAFDTAEGHLIERHGDELMGHLKAGRISTLILPEADAASLTGQDAEGALGSLGKLVDQVILKRGDRGWLVRDGGKVTAIALDDSGAVDFSGSGDAFLAGFLWARAQGRPVLAACDAGATVAAVVVRTPGTRVDDARWAELLATLKGQ